MADAQDPVGRFTRFFREHHTDSISSLAVEKSDGRRSLTINWQQLAEFDTELSRRFLEQPDVVAGYAREALITMGIDRDRRSGSPHIRVCDIDTETISTQLGSVPPGRLVSMSGIIEATTNIHPVVTVGAYACPQCGDTTRGRYLGLGLKMPEYCKSCGFSDRFEVLPGESLCIDAQQARLRITDTDIGAHGDTICLFLADELPPVTPGDTVTVSGVLRPCRDTDIDPRTTTQTRFIESYSVESTAIGPEPAPLPAGYTLGDLSSRPDYLIRLADAVAPTVPGFWRSKLAFVFQYVTPTLPGGETGDHGPNVLIVTPSKTHRRRLLNRMCDITPGAVYHDASDTQRRPLVATIRNADTAPSHWLEGGAVVHASSGLAAIDSLEHIPDTEQPRLIDALANDQVTFAAGGFHVTLDTCRNVVATTTPAGKESGRGTTGLSLDSQLRAEFDLLIRDGLDDTTVRTDLTRVWSVDTSSPDQEASRQHKIGIPEDDRVQQYRTVMAHARAAPDPSLTESARKHLHDSSADRYRHQEINYHEVVAWIAKAIARLCGTDTVTEHDVTRSHQIAFILAENQPEPAI